MDPNTVIVVLAAHLICSGGLLHLIGRRMPPRCGLGAWAAGLTLFGGAYLVRLLIGPGPAAPVAMVIDGAMIGAALLFIAGLHQFVGAVPFRPRRAALVLAAFAVAEGLAIARWGAAGRHVALDLGLGLLYAWLAWSTARVPSTGEPALRLPLRVLTALMGGLALLTLLRPLQVAFVGTGSLTRGLVSQVYYGYASLAAVLLAMGLLWMVFARLNGQLADLATRDALTRVLNRTGLDDALRRHFGNRQALPLVLLAVAVAHFKRVNDAHGHAAGDEMLRAIADTLLANVRPNDLVARIGGEEFLVCCPAPERALAVALAERLRVAVEARAVAVGGATLRCTASVGVSGLCATRAEVERATAEADRALYGAKAAGRNRVMAAA